jgi:hypothetical protein
MNCQECQDLLVEYAEELLEASQKQAVDDHLGDCPECRAEQKQLLSLQNRLRVNARKVGQIDLQDRVFNQILREQHSRLKTARMAGSISTLGGLFMKNPLLKIAAASAAAVLALLVLNSSKGNVTFAQVVQPLLNARNVVFDLIVGDEAEGFSAQDTVVGSKIRRTVPKLHNVLIMDLDRSRMLVLDTASKGAVYVNIEGFMAEGQRDVLNLVRSAISFAMKNPQAVIEELGRQTVGDREAVGFHISDPASETTIWADLDSALPIRIEIAYGETRYTLKNIEFDVPLDESLFSMEVPSGYTLVRQQGDWSDFSEDDFLVVLRTFAEFLLSGNYPETLSLADVMETQPPVGRIPKLANMSEAKAMEILNSYGKGILFFGQLVNSGADWRYTGQGVKFGEADKIVFWYHPPDSSTCRAIYGDLHVEDVLSEELLP